VRIKSFIVPIR